MIDCCIQLSSLTCIMILISYCICCRWLVLVSMCKWNRKWNVYLYIENSRRGMYAIMNNYLFWIMLIIAICVFILTLFTPCFFPFSGREDTIVEMIEREACKFLFVVVYMLCFSMLNIAMLYVVLICFCFAFFLDFL